MITVDHHSCNVLVTDVDRRRFVFGGYDAGYPVLVFRGAAQQLGGNAENNDISPAATLYRELKEEFDVANHNQDYASAVDINTLLQQILANAKPHQDFLLQDPSVRAVKPGRKRESIVSCYIAIISSELLSMVEEHVRQGKKLVTEGEIHYASIDELIEGRKPLAWGTPAVVGQILDAKLPNPFGAQAIPIGEVRESFNEYGEFKYLVGAGTNRDFQLWSK